MDKCRLVKMRIFQTLSGEPVPSLEWGQGEHRSAIGIFCRSRPFTDPSPILSYLSPLFPFLPQEPVGKISSLSCAHQENTNIFCFESHFQTNSEWLWHLKGILAKGFPRFFSSNSPMRAGRVVQVVERLVSKSSKHEVLRWSPIITTKKKKKELHTNNPKKWREKKYWKLN